MGKRKDFRIRKKLGRICSKCHWFKPQEEIKIKKKEEQKGICSHPAYDGTEVTENGYCDGCREGFWDAMHRRDRLSVLRRVGY